MRVCCKWCHGRGRIAVEIGSSQTYPCPDCNGSGDAPAQDYALNPEPDREGDDD